MVCPGYGHFSGLATVALLAPVLLLYSIEFSQVLWGTHLQSMHINFRLSHIFAAKELPYRRGKKRFPNSQI